MSSLPWLGLVIGSVVGMLAACVVGLSAHGTRRWADATRALTQRLQAARVDEKGRSPSARFHLHELDGLPAPVQRYFRAALTDGQPLIAAARVDLVGSINLSARGERWKRFTSQQRVVLHRPGFVWDAEVAVMPGLAVRVVDGYIAGEGVLHVAALGLFTLADTRGDGEMARGELMRYFAEMAWYPTALLPSQGVRWAAVDDVSADASFSDGPLTLTLRFRFNDAGLIGSAHADARGAMVGKEMVMLPWEGRWSNYQQRDGMTVPTMGQAVWLRPEGPAPYFVGRVTSLSYEFLP